MSHTASRSAPPSRSRSLGAALLLTGLTLGADPAAARPPSPREEAGFLLETITVEGAHRVSPELLIAESLLEPGRRYTESELRDAVFRVRRLPFVLEARPSLRKGGRPGTYELVLEIRETNRVFFGANLELVSFGSPLGLEEGASAGFRLTEESDDASMVVGVRHFVGTGGVLFAAGHTENGFQAGYAHHNLFGRRISGAVEVSRGGFLGRVFPLGLDPAFRDWNLDGSQQVRLEVAVPLSPRRAVRLSASWLDGDRVSSDGVLRPSGELRFFRAPDLSHGQLAARWVFDTTDDPILPTRGTAASAGLTLALLEASLSALEVVDGAGPGPPRVVEEPLPTFESVHLAVVASGARHWPVTVRQTVSAGLRASVGRSRVHNLAAGGELHPSESSTSFEASVALRWSLDLRQPRRLRRGGDLRLEAEAGYGFEGTSPSLELAGNPVEKVDLEVALVYRGSWGLVRFAFSYLEAGEIWR